MSIGPAYFSRMTMKDGVEEARSASAGQGGARQKNSDAERARLRRNQRNSRARRAAYVAELEARWSECVNLGAHATGEMQREARRVHAENKVLRKMLQKSGIDEKTIDETVKAEIDIEPDDKLCQGVVCRPGQMCSTEQQLDPSVAEQIPQGASQRNIQQSNESAVQVIGSQNWCLQNWINDLSSLKNAIGANSAHPEVDDIPSNAPGSNTKRGVLDIVSSTLPGLSSDAWNDDPISDTGPESENQGFVYTNGQWDDQNMSFQESF